MDATFRDSLATVNKQGKRNWIYAQRPKGKLYNARSILSYLYFIAFFAGPFIKVGGRPLFLFNVVEGRFIIFGAIFWPQDFFIFGLAMVAFMLFIIIFTMAFGRFFCGWACPQTIFMEMLFRKIEYFIEGDAAAQKVLNQSSWTTEKIFKKTSKQVIFYGLSFLIANTFLAYIIGLDNLTRIITGPVTTHISGLMTMITFAGIFYGVFAFFREQVCTIVCPYGRLQGALLDKNSVIVAYDYSRGEPRSKFKKQQDETIGDCIDCLQCVKVCPTGIDIRNGTQMECVGCTACIDACNFMMEKVNRPLNLIRYASENGIANKEPLRFTPRMKVYASILVVLISAITFMLASRQPVGGDIIRAGGMLYQERGQDSVSNLYRIKLINKTTGNIPLTIRLEDSNGRIEPIGAPVIQVKAEAQGEGTFFIILPKSEIHKRKTLLHIGLYAGKEKTGTIKTTFLGPVNFQ
jgi:cytochrome c oxidase accessory protein FixG